MRDRVREAFEFAVAGFQFSDEFLALSQFALEGVDQASLLQRNCQLIGNIVGDLCITGVEWLASAAAQIEGADQLSVVEKRETEPAVDPPFRCQAPRQIRHL